MRLRKLFVLAALLTPAWAAAAPNPRLLLPDFTALAQKASEAVTITLDPSLLSMAARFLDANNPQDAAAKEVIKGLQGIYVRSYTFDEDFKYQQSDIDAVRKQLSAPGWSRLVETRSQKSHTNVDVFIMVVDNQAVGLAVIASEPREFTIVNIIGAMDLEKLHKLEGQFGIPKLDLPRQVPAPQKAKP